MRSVFYLISIGLVFIGVNLFYNPILVYRYNYIFCFLFIFPYVVSYYESSVWDKDIIARYYLWSSVSVLIYMAIVLFDNSLPFLYNWLIGGVFLIVSCLLFYLLNKSKDNISMWLCIMFLIFHFRGFWLLSDKNSNNFVELISVVGVMLTSLLAYALFKCQK